MASLQGSLIKQCLGLYKSCHHTALLKALELDSVSDIITSRALGLFYQLFSVNSPARDLNCFLLAQYINNDTLIPGSLVQRIVSAGYSPVKAAFSRVKPSPCVQYDGFLDSIKQIVYNEHFIKPYSIEHNMLLLLLKSF